jgi:hypothetical protein
MFVGEKLETLTLRGSLSRATRGASGHWIFASPQVYNRLAAKLGRGKDSFPTQSEENPMKKILLAALLSTFAAGALAQEATCKSQATEKSLAGAALKSFMTKCQKDATASCTGQAADKKLSGAAKTSFTKKCVRDAVGT